MVKNLSGNLTVFIQDRNGSLVAKFRIGMCQTTNCSV
nr:MAG TPA: hypothetical protein [Caudoviricetes sp.]